jgi:putative transposase
MQHEPTLSLINRKWLICYAIEAQGMKPINSDLAIALDPGVRTFLTGFDGSDFTEIGKSDIGRIGCISILQGRSMTADNLLVITRDLLRSCFAPTNIFAKMRCARRIYRLARHLDKLMSRIGVNKGRQFKRLRYCLRKSAAKIRIEIKNLVNELHKKAAKYIAAKYKLIFLPTFETQQMVKKGSRKLATKTARAMVTLSHYRFKQMLKHQAAKHGGIVVDVTEEYTSKNCSNPVIFTLNLV